MPKASGIYKRFPPCIPNVIPGIPIDITFPFGASLYQLSCFCFRQKPGEMAIKNQSFTPTSTSLLDARTWFMALWVESLGPIMFSVFKRGYQYICS
jgi:hypothetical protein